MKEQIIQIPDTLEVKEIKDGKIILVEKEKKLTYEDIIEQLYPCHKIHYFIDNMGVINSISTYEDNRFCENNATSKKQLEKLLAINKLMNVAKYLNDGWQPFWKDKSENKYYITICEDEIAIEYAFNTTCINVYFKSREVAEQAVEILGEETIRLALCTDY